MLLVLLRGNTLAQAGDPLRDSIEDHFQNAVGSPERQAAFDALIGHGAIDFLILLQEFENTNTVYMFTRNELIALVQSVESQNGSPAPLLGSSRAALLDGTRFAARVKGAEIIGDYADGASASDLMSTLLDSTAATPIREAAAAAMGYLSSSAFSPNYTSFTAVISSYSEPLALREQALASLWKVDPYSARNFTTSLINDYTTPDGLRVRAFDELATSNSVYEIASYLGGSHAPHAIRALCEVNTSESFTYLSYQGSFDTNEKLDALLEGLGTNSSSYFDSNISSGLYSSYKTTRMLAMRAAARRIHDDPYQTSFSWSSLYYYAYSAEELHLIEILQYPY